ncbi:DNA-directed RNA polymerase II subunit RPB9 [Nematocida sp. AWRm77]|nr:DNA-directed RNA polymerase II subunit RPB9 [Nematocida sp. AWRm77]
MGRETKQFCRECNNMLYPKEDKQEKTLYLACRNCEHFEEAVSPVVYTVQYASSLTERATLSTSAKDIAADPTYKRVRHIQCTRCGGRVHVVFQTRDIQEESALGVNYVCCVCFKIESSLQESVPVHE